MKPTTESIALAISSAANIRDCADGAVHDLSEAKVAFECQSPMRARKTLELARERIVHLRRTQTALLRNIADALQSF